MKNAFKSTIERANIICEALPYIRKYSGKTLVIKYGGNAMNDEAVTTTILQDIAALKIVGVNPILVHGGGPEINKMLSRLGIEAQFKNGMRVTDKETMEIAQMILCGKINKNIVGELNSMGVKAIGLCGKDSQLIKAENLDPELGYVGKITEINAKLLEILAKDEFIPVIASIATDEVRRRRRSYRCRHARRKAFVPVRYRRNNGKQRQSRIPYRQDNGIGAA